MKQKLTGLGSLKGPNYKYILNRSLDIFLVLMIASFFLHDFLSLILILTEDFLGSRIYDSMFTNMVETVNTTGAAESKTITSLIHEDGTWSNTIRSLFIYGAGAAKLHLLRGQGTPSQRGFTIASALALDSASKIIQMTINDPSYVLSHKRAYEQIINGDSGTVKVGSETAGIIERLTMQVTSPMVITAPSNSPAPEKVAEITSSSASASTYLPLPQTSVSTSLPLAHSPASGKDAGISSFLPNFKGLEAISDSLTKGILEFLGPILKPVKVSYSNEILASQLHFISVLLFIISLPGGGDSFLVTCYFYV